METHESETTAMQSAKKQKQKPTPSKWIHRKDINNNKRIMMRLPSANIYPRFPRCIVRTRSFPAEAQMTWPAAMTRLHPKLPPARPAAGTAAVRTERTATQLTATT